MARPKKSGLDYFPFDVDFFNDEKMVAIAGEFGIKGELTVIKLLCAIYRNGYFILWSEMLQMKMLAQLPGVSVELLNAIVSRLVRWGFFDKDLFDSATVLTSVAIQKRYFDAISRRSKDEIYPHLLVSVDILHTKTPIKEELLSTKTPQKKVNNTKNKFFVCKHAHTHTRTGEDIKQELLGSQIWCDQVAKTYHLSPDELRDCVNDVVDYEVITSPNPTKSDCMRLFPKQVEIYRSKPKGSLQDRKAKLEQEMRVANADDIYPREVLRAFFQYWTQTDASGTKMLFENNQFWDTAKRLDLWKNRKD